MAHLVSLEVFIKVPIEADKYNHPIFNYSTRLIRLPNIARSQANPTYIFISTLTYTSLSSYNLSIPLLS